MFVKTKQLVFITFAFLATGSAAPASPLWEEACNALGTSEGWCGDIYRTVASMIVDAEDHGYKLDARRVRVSFEFSDPRVPVGTVRFTDGKIRCAQKLAGWQATAPLSCRRGR